MKGERPDHTLQPTALVHEAVGRLLDDSVVADCPGRAYFFGTVARAMRRVLIDHGRAWKAERRGGNLLRAPLDAVLDVVQLKNQLDLLAFDDALERLSKVCQRHVDIVVLKFFGGMTMQEIAARLEVSLSTAESDWRLARAWLSKELA
jgi:RNA polymerase sigma-70 factor, ECF subfamily